MTALPKAFQFTFPIKGHYRFMRVDKGQDFQTTPGTPLVAAVSGTLAAGSDPTGFGPHYPILHGDNGRSYYYGHVTLPPGFEGKRVTAGQVITHTGAPQGNATSPGWFEFGDASLLGQGGETGGGPISQLLHRAVGGSLKVQPIPGGLGGGADAQTGGAAAIQPQLNAETQLAAGVANTLWDAVSKDAMRMLLYVLLVAGGLALALGGVKKLGREPAST